MADVLALAEQHAVPCGQVNTAKDMLADAHIAAREAIVRLAHPVLGDVPMQAPAPHLSATLGRLQRPAPMLGEHTEEILTRLGIAPDAQAELKARGVI